MTVELNPRFSFDSFVVGAANRLAVTAGRTVAESPGTAYNPLLIYSVSGLGKTHLLMAIGQMAKHLQPNLRVEYLTLDEFVEGYHAALAAGQNEAFRNRFTGVDALLVDDVQFLTNRRELQAELLRITQLLTAANKQIVLTSDRPPAEIENLDDRLVQRFDGGLVVDIGPPDFETRRAILERWAHERSAGFAAGVLDAAAGFEVENVRELLGLLNRLVAYQAVSEAPLTPDAAQSLLDGHVPTRPSTASRAAAASESAPDEFASFLSGVSSTVAEQVAAWRARLTETIERWQAEGYRTARLETLLAEDSPPPGGSAVQAFERDIARLRNLQKTMRSVDPEAADDPMFFDPDRVQEVAAAVERLTEEVAAPPGPSPAWTFDTFTGGESNKVALKAAREAVRQPGAAYNPLVFVGPTGVGKTHLLHAVGHALMQRRNEPVGCLSAQQFLDELVKAIDVGKVEIWRSRFRRVAAFLLDDVHLLAGKERTQQELFNLFNLLHDSGRQLGFTINAPPAQVEGLDERLVSRLEGGLVAQLEAPDRGLRREIVLRKLEERLGAAEENLVEYLAARPADSIRAVLGLVQRVMTAAEERGVALEAAFARELIEGATPPRRRSSTGLRTSGLVVSPMGGLRNREKMVWYWPDPSERIVEEMF